MVSSPTQAFFIDHTGQRQYIINYLNILFKGPRYINLYLWDIYVFYRTYNYLLYISLLHCGIYKNISGKYYVKQLTLWYTM